MGSREDAAAKIDTETVFKIDSMLKALSLNKDFVIHDVLFFVYDINPVVHRNYLLRLGN